MNAISSTGAPPEGARLRALEYQLHHALDQREIAADLGLTVLVRDRSCSGQHVDRMLRRGEALERALAQAD